jgi:pimeloyl-ACP methyl ester carboxylesterase
VRRLRRTLLAAGALVALACLSASSAAARAPGLRACPDDSAFRCGVVRVPLDRTGAVPGVVRLHFAAARERRRRVLVALSGGPGQASLYAAGDFAFSLEPALKRYRLVVLDQRGTGRSGVLDCPAVQRALSLDVLGPEETAACARRLGRRRAFYATADTVLDLEALRQALGVQKIALMGISYGTHVALQYARAYPQHVDRLILDSIVGPGDPDAFLLDSYARLPRVLREQCAGGACRSVTRDPVADVATLVRRLAAGGPLRGTVFGDRGRRHRAALRDGAELNFFLTAADLNPALQAALPAAVAAAARRRDLGPLLRLRRAAQGTPLRLGELSWGLNLATSCADARLPFALTTPLAQRPALVQSALAAIPPTRYAPWDAASVERTSDAQSCLRWPLDAVRPSSSAPLPDVPALLLGGRLDLRTPFENAEATAHELPRARLVALRGSGHDVLDSDVTGCSAKALARFVADRAVGRPCAGKDNGIRPTPLPPRSLRDFRSAPGVGGWRGRALFAVLDTVADARLAVAQLAGSGLPPRGGGLRRGSFASRLGPGGGEALVLRDFAYVPGLRVTGSVRRSGRGRGTLEIRGRGVNGRLALDGRGGATGVLGGRAVRFREGRRGARAAGAGAGRRADGPGLALPDRVEEQLEHQRLRHERGQGRP